MKKEESEKVIKIFLECDGACEYFVSTLLKLFVDKSPEFQNLTEITFKSKFNKELKDFLNQQHKEE